MGNRHWITCARPLAVLLAILLLLTGCWDRIEIEERAVILGLAVDLGGTEEEDEKVSHIEGAFPTPDQPMIRVTAQIAVPGRIPLGPGSGGGGNQQTVWALEVVGHTLDGAMSNLQQQISSPLFFGHLRIIVVSETYARQGLETISDYLRRNPEVRRMTWMVVSKGTASSLMRAAPELERVPTLYLLSTLDQAIQMGKFPEDFIGHFWSNASKKGQEGYLPYVEVKKTDNVQISGMAIFRGDRMVGTTLPLEIAMFMSVKGVNPAGYMAYARTSDDPDDVAMFVATHRKSHIDLEIRDGRPHFTARMIIEGNVVEKMDGEIRLDEAMLRRIQRNLEENAEKTTERLIRNTQRMHADIFGFGEIVRAKKPGYWNREIGTKSKWQDMYTEATFDLDVSINIRRIGMIAN